MSFISNVEKAVLGWVEPGRQDRKVLPGIPSSNSFFTNNINEENVRVIFHQGLEYKIQVFGYLDEILIP
jgi:hypothetical protein